MGRSEQGEVGEAPARETRQFSAGTHAERNTNAGLLAGQCHLKDTDTAVEGELRVIRHKPSGPFRGFDDLRVTGARRMW